MFPLAPIEPAKFIDQTRFPASETDISDKYGKVMKALEARIGAEYYDRIKKVQARVWSYGASVFPAYGLLYLDVLYEDWLSLVDIHPKFARDHSVHQPLTAYIVCKLLGGGNSDESFKIGGVSLLDKALDVILGSEESQYLRDRLKYYEPNSNLLSGDRELWKLVFYQTAMITAFYHDIGYPWEFIERMHSSLYDQILFFGQIPDNSDRIKAYIDEHKDELMFRPFYNYGKGGLTPEKINEVLFSTLLRNSHGLPGALAYWEYNDHYRLKENLHNKNTVKFCQEWSCLAILMHDMLDAYETKGAEFPCLDFKTDPLSYIIALADTLEDFNRPNATIVRDPKGNGSIISYSFPSLSVDLEEKDGKATIQFTMDPDPTIQENQKFFKSKDQKKLFDPGGYFDLKSLGLNTLTIEVK